MGVSHLLFDTTLKMTAEESGECEKVDVLVEATYSPATPDVFYLRNGDPGYPGSPAELEIIRIEVTSDTTSVVAKGTLLEFDELPEKDQDSIMALGHEEAVELENQKYDRYERE